MAFAGWQDGSVLEAASWRLASELCRRHPTTTHLIRAHPGDGQSDCLWVLPLSGHLGDVRLNRNGTIQVLERFDGQDVRWEATEWDTYLRADPYRFLRFLEAEAGLRAPSTVPSSTPRTLTLRVLASLAAIAIKSVDPVEIEPGYIDTASYGGGVNQERFRSFPAIGEEKLGAGDDNHDGEAANRFWFVVEAGEPLLAFEADTGLVWTRHANAPSGLIELYATAERRVELMAADLMRRAT